MKHEEGRDEKRMSLNDLLGDRIFRLIFEASPNAMFLADRTGKFLIINSAAEKLYGYPMEEFYKMNNIKLVPERFHQLYLDNRAQFFADPFRKDLFHQKERIGIRKDGTEMPLEISFDPVESSEELLLLATVVDISAKKKQEEELWKMNKFLDSILENIPNMIFVKDAAELRFVRFNKAGEDLLGYSRKDLIGKNDYDFFPKEQADFFTGKDREVLQKFDVFDIPEEPIDTRSGKRWLHTKKITVKDDRGKPAYLLGISDDITQRKRSEDEIRQLNEDLKKNISELESANNELESFSYSVSHDMRAPIRAINGFTALLKKNYADTLDEEGRDFLNTIIRESSRMGRLIDDLLAFSKLGKKELQKEKCNLTKLVKEVAFDSLKAEIEKYKTSVVIHDLPFADCDPSLMRQVLINLLGNAIKFSGLKEQPVVEIGATIEGSVTTYYIKDNGAGFDMKYYDKLFGVFQRLHAADDFPGTGIGLAIVKRVISKHGGKVWATGNVGEGSTFYFSIPTAIPGK